MPFQIELQKADNYVRLQSDFRANFEDLSHQAELMHMLERELPDLEKTPYLDKPNIERIKLEKLKKIVDYAYNNIQLYKDKYGAIGYKAGSLVGFEDFERLPIIMKDDILRYYPEGIVRELQDFQTSVRTSGSSGHMVTLSRSLDAIYRETILWIRQLRHQTNNRFNPGDRLLLIFGAPWWFSSIGDEYHFDFIPFDLDFSNAIQRIQEVDPTVIFVYPSYLRKLCDIDQNWPNKNLRLVVVNSEQTTAQERQRLSEMIGAPVLDEYAAEEMSCIAYQCSHRKYHIEDDCVHLEIVDPATRTPVPDGVKGSVVCTNLLNFGTPLIRYDLGDISAISTKTSCSCGSNFRLLEGVEGRLNDAIVLDDGSWIPGATLMDLAYRWFWDFNIPTHGLQYKIIQQPTGELDVNLVTTVYEVDPELIKESLYTVLPANFEVNVKLVDTLPHVSGKKQRCIISHRERPY